MKKSTTRVGLRRRNAIYGVIELLEPRQLLSVEPILSGADWRDVDGNRIEAHEGGILQEGGTFYLYGTDRSQNNSWFNKINLYASTDMVHWKFRKSILSYTSNSALNNGAVVERPKLVRNPTTGKYVLWFHYDNSSYSLAEVGHAECDTIDGNYTYLGAIHPQGADSRDMGLFQDTDGKAYLICSITYNGSVNGAAALYQLDDTYSSVTNTVFIGTGNLNGEGHSIVKVNGIYFWFKSSYSGWTPNDNYYATATSLGGTWTNRGNFVPSGSGTFFSQNYFTMTVTGTSGTSYFFMGDRWQSQAHSQDRSIFLPLTFSGTTASMRWYDAWTIDTVTGLWTAGSNLLGGTYKIVSRTSGLALTATGTANGSMVEQDSYTGASTQQWTVTALGNTEGSYRITNVASGRVLDVTGNSTANNGTIEIYDNYSTGNQKWRISSTDSGYFSVMGVNSRKVLDMPSGSTAEGTDVQQYDRNGSLWQEWAFIPVDNSAVPAAPSDVVAMMPNGTVGQVRLDWTPVSGAVSYQVKQATSAAGPFTAIGSLVIVPSATFAVTADTLYYYTVTAINSFGESIASTPVRFSSSKLRGWYAGEGNVTDSSTNLANGTNNGATFVTGRDGGQALQFNGTNQSVTIPRVVGLNDFTISFWMKTTQTGATGSWGSGKGLVDSDVNGVFADFGVSLLGNKVAFGIGGIGFGTAGVTDTTIISNTIVNDGQWHYVAATYSVSSGFMKLYVDGELEKSLDGPGGARIASSAIRLGAIQSGASSSYFNGSLDDVRLYEGILSASEIGSLYDPTLVAGNGTWTSDASGNWGDTSKWTGSFPAYGSGTTADFSTLNISGDRTVTLDKSRVIGTLRFGDTSGTQSWTLNSSGSATLTLDATSPAIIVSQNTAMISAILLGTAGFTKSGAGTLIFNGSNPLSGILYLDSGSTTANDGAVRIAKSAAIAGLSSIYIRNNNSGYSTLQLDGNAESVSITQGITLSGRNGVVPAIQNLVGTNTISGNLFITTGGSYYILQSDAGLLTLSGALSLIASGTRNFTFQGNGNISVTGIISNGTAGGTAGIIKSGTGTLLLGAVNSYTGTTTVNAGTLLLGNSERIANSSALVLNGGTFATGGFTETLATLSLSANAIIDLGSGTSSLTFNGVGTLTSGKILAITNWTKGSDHLFIGTTASLTAAQLAQITLNGLAVQQLSTGEIVLADQTAPTLLSVVSRKTQGAAGTFDLALNLTGEPTTESRLGGPTTLVFTFSETVMATDGLLDASEFVLGNASFVSASLSGNLLTLQLTGAVNGSRVSVALRGLQDSAGNVLSGTSTLTIRSLLGNVVAGNNLIDLTDLQEVKNRQSQALSAVNFLCDVDANGIIDSLDMLLIKNALRTSVV